MKSTAEDWYLRGNSKLHYNTTKKSLKHQHLVASNKPSSIFTANSSVKNYNTPVQLIFQINWPCISILSLSNSSQEERCPFYRNIAWNPNQLCTQILFHNSHKDMLDIFCANFLNKISWEFYTGYLRIHLETCSSESTTGALILRLGTGAWVH